MWEVKLLSVVASKCFKNSEVVEPFIRDFEHFLKIELGNDNKQAALIFLRIITDINQFATFHLNNSISLVDFSRYCLGVAILHLKNATKKEAFLSLEHHQILYSALNLQGEVKRLEPFYDDDSLRTPAKTAVFNQHTVRREERHQLALNAVIQQLEVEALRFLDQRMCEDDNWLYVFNQLLKKSDEARAILFNLYSSIRPYLKVPEYQLLARTVKNALYGCEPKKSTGSGIAEFKEHEVQHIYAQLQNYCATTGYLSMFGCCKSVKYKVEATDIIKQMEAGVLITKASILKALESLGAIPERDGLFKIVSYCQDNLMPNSRNVHMH